MRDQSGPTKLIGKEPLLAAFTPRSAKPLCRGSRLPHLLSHMSSLECTRPARTPTSICACVALLMSYILMYQRRPDAPALPRNAASRDSWSMMIFAFVLQREIDMLVVRAHDHMHMYMCSSAHQLHFAVSKTPRRARAAEKWPISQIFVLSHTYPTSKRGIT